MKSDAHKKSNETVSPALKQEFRNLGALIENNTHKIESVAEQVGGLMQDMTTVKGRLDIIQSDVEIIKNDLKRKVDLQDFEALTHRVSTLERRVLK